MTDAGWQGEPHETFDLVTRGARRALLELVIAVGTGDVDGAAIGGARLRWALAAATRIAEPRLRSDLVANAALEELRARANQWLGREPRALSAEEVRRFVARIRSASPGQLVATAAVIDGLDLDDLDLSALSAREARLTDVSARRAELVNLDATRASLRGCRFFDGDLEAAVFDDAYIEACDFSRSRLRRSSWRRSVVAEVNFIAARMECASMDGAVFSGCDLSSVMFGSPAGAAAPEIRGTRFEACDLRESSWHGRRLVDVVFSDCKMFGVHGMPQLKGVTVDRADLSAGGDGSQLATEADVIAGWGTLAGPGARAAPAKAQAPRTWRRR